MLLTSIIVWVSVFFLLIASVEDLKTGEIPERVSRSFVVVMLVSSLVYSVWVGDLTPLASSLVIAVSYFVFAYMIYRLGQWGGGDVKLMAGVGCAIGLLNSVGYDWPYARLMPYFLSYVINMGFLALPYALLYSFILTARNPSVLIQFREYLRDRRSQFVLLLSFMPSLAALHLDYVILATLYLVIPFVVTSLIYLRAIEQKALQKTIPVSELVEGDVLAEGFDGGVGVSEFGRGIEGLSLEEVSGLKVLAASGKIPGEVRVKWGVRFAPILFLSFVLTVWTGNLMEIVFLRVLV